MQAVVVQTVVVQTVVVAVVVQARVVVVVVANQTTKWVAQVVKI